MAKMNKKNFAKYLPKAGGAAVVAVAMSVALATPANAADVDDLLELTNPPIDNGEESTTPAAAANIEPAEANEAIEQANEEVVEENAEIAEDNQEIADANDEAAAENAENSDGALEDPQLETPEAPENPDTDDLDAEEYNEEIGNYNEQVDDYNDKVDDYNEQVDDYNAKADAVDQAAQDQYEEDKQAYEDAKAEHDQAVEDYEAEKEAHDQAVEDYDAYVEEKEAYDTQKAAYDAYQTALANYNNALSEYNTKYQQYLTDSATYNDNLTAYNNYVTAKNAYDTAYSNYQTAMGNYNTQMGEYETAYANYLIAKGEYETAMGQYNAAQQQHESATANYNTENQIYNDVNTYNEGITNQNQQIADQNQALEDAVGADNVSNIGEVGDINKNNVHSKLDASVLAELSKYDALVTMLNQLQADAAALENHAGKDQPLSSEAYAQYLTAVEAYNTAVESYNAAVTAYNNAIKAYNEAVEDYNLNKESFSETFLDSSYQVGTADWGNINVNNITLNHIDVKYDAAATKNVTVENGVTTYSNTVTKYTVTGVYANEESVNNKGNYSLSFLNSKNNVEVQKLSKDDGNDEFGGDHNSRTVKYSPADTKVSFYMTLTDGTNNYGISVNLDASSVYAEGSYYKADPTDRLDEFKDKNGKGLTKVTIGGEEYYDISGQSVFVISALTCEGMTNFGNKLNPNGLDLVLNLKTMINIFQSTNAQTIGYQTLELGKTAQNTAPTNPGDFDQTKPTLQDPPKVPTKPEDFTLTPPTPVTNPGDKAPEAPTPPDPFTMEEVTDPGEAPTEVKHPGDAPVKPDDFTLEAPEAPTPSIRLEHLNKLDKLDDKIIMVVPEAPVEETPEVPATPAAPAAVATAGDGLIVINDNEVPLAKAPKTGDVSGLWAASGIFSLLGIGFLNRKRKEEDTF